MEIDERTRALLTVRAKRQLRQRMRALRRATPAKALAARSASIVEAVAGHSAFARARSVALFWPMNEQNEVDLRELDTRARAHHKRVYYPFADLDTSPPRLGFRLTGAPDELKLRGSRFLEPLPDAPEAAPGDIDLVVVPALAVCESGHRIGFGSGFYDEVLPRLAPPACTLVVAFDFQMLAEIPAEAHDVAADIVITDRRVVEVEKSAGA